MTYQQDPGFTHVSMEYYITNNEKNWHYHKYTKEKGFEKETETAFKEFQ